MLSTRMRTSVTKLLLLLLATASQAAAFTATTAAKLSTTSAATSAIYEGLASTPLIRASDSSPVLLTDLWRANTPFGIGDEYAVCAFLRHYG